MSRIVLAVMAALLLTTAVHADGVFRQQLRVPLLFSQGTSSGEDPNASIAFAYPTSSTIPAGVPADIMRQSTSGDIAGLTWRHGSSGGPFPMGMTVDVSTGRLTGTPIQPGIFDGIVVELVDGHSSLVASSTPFEIVVSSPVIEISAADLTVHSNSTLSMPVSLSGGYAPGVTVSGLSGVHYSGGAIVNSGGTLPTGAHVLTAVAFDGYREATAMPTLTVVPPLAASIVGGTSITGSAGTSITVTPDVANALGTVSWSAPGRPAWLSAPDGSGVVTGTPSTPGTYSLTLIASDGHGPDASVTASIVVSGGTVTWARNGTFVSGTGAITPPLPTGILDGDVLILVQEVNGAQNPASIAGWTQITGATGGGATHGGIRASFKRVSGPQTAPVITDSGDHQSAYIFALRGVKSDGEPFTGTVFSDGLATGTSGSLGSFTIPSNGLAIAIGVRADDSAAHAFSWSASGAIFGTVQKEFESGHTDGDGGGFSIATSPVTAGTAPNPSWSYTLSRSVSHRAIGFVMLAGP